MQPDPSSRSLGTVAKSRGDRIRTYDFLVPNQAHYQAVLHPARIARPDIYAVGKSCKRKDGGPLISLSR